MLPALHACISWMRQEWNNYHIAVFERKLHIVIHVELEDSLKQQVKMNFNICNWRMVLLFEENTDFPSNVTQDKRKVQM